MIFIEALELSRKFPTCNPRMFKGFTEWSISNISFEDYIVIADASLAKKTCFNELEDHVKCHNLIINLVKDYLMICNIS